MFENLLLFNVVWFLLQIDFVQINWWDSLKIMIIVYGKLWQIFMAI